MEQSANINDTRERIEQGMLAKFGEAFEKSQAHAQQLENPALREKSAERMALEHAVLQTALEKDMPTRHVTQMLEKASPQQVARLVREGRKSIHKSYGIEADAMVAALSAKVADVDLPRSIGTTEPMKQLIEQGRALVQRSTLDAFQSRGHFQQGRGPRDEQLQLRTEAGRPLTAKEELTNHMVFIESAVDSAVKAGRFNEQQGQMLKQRIENGVFNVPREARLSQQFTQFQEATGPRLRQEVMNDARRVTQNRTVAEIAQRLHEARERVARMRDGPER